MNARETSMDLDDAAEASMDLDGARKPRWTSMAREKPRWTSTVQTSRSIEVSSMSHRAPSRPHRGPTDVSSRPIEVSSRFALRHRGPSRFALRHRGPSRFALRHRDPSRFRAAPSRSIEVLRCAIEVHRGFACASIDVRGRSSKSQNFIGPLGTGAAAGEGALPPDRQGTHAGLQRRVLV